MTEFGKVLRESLFDSRPKTHTGKCRNCGYPLELYEIDFKKSMRVLKCTRCGLFHFYKRDLIGRWKLLKAAKIELPK